MEHIRQKLTIEGKESTTYTVVITDNWTEPLAQHPAMLEHPEVFEISTDPIPADCQYLQYISENN